MANPTQPPYSEQHQKFVPSDDLVLLASAARASGTTNGAEQSPADELVIELDVTGTTGGDGNMTLDVVLEESTDGGSTWTQVDAFATVGEADVPTSERVTVGGTAEAQTLAADVRASATVNDPNTSGGDFTFSVKAV